MSEYSLLAIDPKLSIAGYREYLQMAAPEVLELLVTGMRLAGIPEARLASGVRQVDLAKAVGITQGFLSDIERGRRELGEQHYEKLPEPIRTTVIKAAKAELQDRIRMLVQIGKHPPGEKPRKT